MKLKRFNQYNNDDKNKQICNWNVSIQSALDYHSLSSVVIIVVDVAVDVEIDVSIDSVKGKSFLNIW